jgi:Predicted dehydrogenases and related proteins
MAKKINVAIAGLGFGAEFIPIYQLHPNANMYAICQRNKANLDKTGDYWKVDVRYTDFDEMLKDPNIDAVHINTPIPDHASQSIKSVESR